MQLFAKLEEESSWNRCSSVYVITVTGTEAKRKLFILLNRISQSGDILNDFKTSTFIPILKKKDAKECSDRRLICIMSHVLKLLFAILNKQLYGNIDILT